MSTSCGLESHNILFLIGQLSLGGSERSLYLLIRELDRTKYKSHVVSLDVESDQRDIGHELESLGVHAHRLGNLNWRKSIFHLLGIVKKIRPTIIHSFTYYTNPYASLAAKMIEGACTIGSVRFNPTEQTLHSIPWYVKLSMFRFVDVLVANSQSASTRLGNGNGSSSRLTYIPNGVQVPSWEEIHHLREWAERELAINPDEVVIGTVARIDQNKNLTMLLQAFEPLVRLHSNVRLVMIGDGPLKKELETLVQDSGLTGRVQFMGRRNDARQLMTRFDVFCLTSRNEGMPNAIMEASAIACPVIATNVGGIPDIVVNGETGYLVSIDDIKGFTSKLDDLIKNKQLRERFGHAGRKRMEQHFSVAKMVTTYEKLYEELLNSNGCSPASLYGHLRMA